MESDAIKADTAMLLEEARRIYKESDGWPFQAFTRFIFFAAGYYSGKDLNFSGMVSALSDIMYIVTKEAPNV